MREYTGKLKAGYSGRDSMRDNAEKAFRGQLDCDMNPKQSFSSKGRTKVRLYAEGGGVEDSNMKRGGGTRKVHRLTKEQTDLHLPTMKKSRRSNAEGFSKSGEMKHSGRKKHKFDDGGEVVGDEMDAPAAAPAPRGLLGRAASAFNSARPLASKALNFARANAPKAQEMLDQYSPRLGSAFQRARNMAPQVESSYKKYAPQVDSALNFAKANAPRAQQMLDRYSPALGSRFGKARSFLGLKKGGKASGGEINMKEEGNKDDSYAMGGVGKIRHKQADKKGKPIGPRSKFVR